MTTADASAHVDGTVFPDTERTRTTTATTTTTTTTTTTGTTTPEQDSSWYVVQPAPSSMLIDPVLLCSWNELNVFCQRICPCTAYEKFSTLVQAAEFLQSRRRNSSNDSDGKDYQTRSTKKIQNETERKKKETEEEKNIEKKYDGPAATAAERNKRQRKEAVTYFNRIGEEERERRSKRGRKIKKESSQVNYDPYSHPYTKPDPVRMFQNQFTHNLPRLQEYVQEYGTADVPARKGLCVLTNGRVVDISTTRYKGLGGWLRRVRTQLKLYNLSPAQSMLSRDQAKALKELGFVYEPPEQVWNEKYYKRAVEYKEQFGSLDLLPLLAIEKNDEWRQLRVWLKQMNDAHHKQIKGEFSTIIPDHVQKLRALGFAFDTPKKHKTFDERATEWLAFKANTGLDEPQSPDDGLRRWILTQRRRHRDFKVGRPTPLTKAQVDKLNQWNFPWGSQDGTCVSRAATNIKTFDERLHDLIRYKEEFGDTLVPQKYPGLGGWVSEQRMAYQRRIRPELSRPDGHGPLSDERLAKLQAVGFVFDLQPNGPRFLKAEGKQKDLQTRKLNALGGNSSVDDGVSADITSPEDRYADESYTDGAM